MKSAFFRIGGVALLAALLLSSKLAFAWAPDIFLEIVDKNGKLITSKIGSNGTATFTALPAGDYTVSYVFRTDGSKGLKIPVAIKTGGFSTSSGGVGGDPKTQTKTTYKATMISVTSSEKIVTGGSIQSVPKFTQRSNFGTSHDNAQLYRALLATIHHTGGELQCVVHDYTLDY